MKRNALGLKIVVSVAVSGVLGLASRAADSITNFGLVHTPLGQAVVFPDGNVFVNVTTNRGDGVSIHLGESDSGVFLTPLVPWSLEPHDFLHGDVYGQLNGMTNQRLASARGTYRGWDEGWGTNWVWENDWLWDDLSGGGEYTAAVDLSPLGGSSLTVVAMAGNQVVGVVSNAARAFAVWNGEWNWGNPLRRVAPFWRMPDGSVGALFDFLVAHRVRAIRCCG